MFKQYFFNEHAKLDATVVHRNFLHCRLAWTFFIEKKCFRTADTAVFILLFYIVLADFVMEEFLVL